MLKILICDDQIEWLNEIEKNLKKALSDTPYKIKAFQNAEELLNFLSDDTADILITDIQMPQMDGIELAKRIFSSCKHTRIIFTSVYPEYVQDVFEVKPVFFLIKPFSEDKFREAVTLALQGIEERKHTIEILSKSKTVYIRSSEIIYVESFKRNVVFHEKDSTESCNAKLSDIENQLPNYFVRCHQSYLVNCHEIKRISNNEIELQSGESIPVAKSRFTDVKNFVTQFWVDQL